MDVRCCGGNSNLSEFILVINTTKQNAWNSKRQSIAYQETKKAFELLAENFGRGTEKVAYLTGV